MSDVLTPEQRSKNMAAIRSVNTEPEMLVRRLVHSLGYRFRLHKRDLPGTPDLVFPKYKKVIFVHGCYWHMHNCRYGKVYPRTHAKFWQNKRKSNVSRDRRNIRALSKAGWKHLVIWECQIKNPERLIARILNFLVT